MRMFLNVLLIVLDRLQGCKFIVLISVPSVRVKALPCSDLRQTDRRAIKVLNPTGIELCWI